MGPHVVKGKKSKPKLPAAGGPKMMVTENTAFGKASEQFQQMVGYVERAAQNAERVDRVERELFKMLFQLGYALLCAYFKAVGDGNEGERLQRGGEILTRFEKKRTRLYRSIFGVLEVVRFVYGKRQGQKAYSPFDAQLGMPAGEQSYVLEDWLQRFCVQNSFSASVNSIEDLLGIQTSVRTAERINREMGVISEAFRETQEEVDPATEKEILVLSADGKGVPVRGTLEEQSGQPEPAWRKCHEKRQAAKADERAEKRLGRGKVKIRKQMAYVGAVYTIASWVRTAEDVLNEIRRTEQKATRPKPQNKRVWAEMTCYRGDERVDGQPKLFAKLAQEIRCRGQNVKAVVCLMDGQRSLWGLKNRLMGEIVIGILDIYHVTEWLWKAAYCFHPESSRSAEEFVTHYLRMLLEGKVSYVIGSLRRKHSNLKGSKAKSLESVLRYFDNNKQYMHYDDYLAAGYPIGSGVVEGACRHLVRDRMEQTGMRWNVQGAQAMLNTRSVYLNLQWDEFIEYRIETEQNALYAQAA